MIEVKPMLSATALVSGLGLAAASAAGFGSFGFVLAVVLAFANLAVLAVLVRLSTAAVKRGEPAAAGLAALHGKTLVLLAAMAFLTTQVGPTPVALGFVLVMTSFTLAVPLVALTHTRQTVEAL